MNMTQVRMAKVSGLFPENFTSSRDRFLEKTMSLGATVSSLPLLPEAAQHNSGLSIDIATIGDASAPRTLLYIAGTHGIEGFIGSAIQYAIVSGLKEIPSGCNIALIHCLNPWGMTNLRRTNERNIDLNRNCTISDEERSGAPPGYDELKSLLLPERGRSFPMFCVETLGVVFRHGFAAAKQAVTGGQYVDQRGLFYGGLELQPELELVRQWARENLADKQRVLVVDVHSGLGSFGQDSLIVDHSDHSDEHKRMRELFPGYQIHGPDPSRSISYETRGSIGALLPAILPNTTVDYVVHEFGTLHPFRVLHALVQENFHFFQSGCTIGEQNRHPSSLLLKDAFCPASTEWRDNAVSRGLAIFEAAKQALANEALRDS
jgi:hypothetical protein